MFIKQVQSRQSILSGLFLHISQMYDKINRLLDKLEFLDVHKFEEKERMDVFLQECVMHG